MVTNRYPTVVGSRRLPLLAAILRHPFYTATIPLVTGLLAWLRFFLGWMDDPYKLTFLAIGAFAIFVSLTVPVAARLCRYELLSVEIRQALKHLPIDSDTFLLGVGGGSFKAIGMVLKAWEEEKPNAKPPHSLCLRMAKNRDAGTELITFYPSLDRLESMINTKLVIVVAQIGTGRTARAVKEWADSIESVTKTDIFALIISEAAADSGEWKGAFTLGVVNRGNVSRSVLPWVSIGDEF